MAFQFDTSGIVQMPEPFEAHGRGYWDWSDLSPFMQGYVRAALGGLETPWGAGYKIMRPVAFYDLAPDTLAAMMADCEMVRANWSLSDDARRGREFWERRQASHPTTNRFPPLTLTIRDDGLVYQEARS